jgi:1-acyl-sn-glycerol-3-phosphate acyltransferase
MPPLSRRSATDVLNWLLVRLTSLTVEGTENIPPTGGVILTTNHMSRVDTPLLLITVPRKDLGALIAHKYRFNPLFAFLVWSTESIWINREITDFKAIRSGVNMLRSGRILGIAPEGTRSRVGSMIKAKSGAALIADRSNAVIQPVAIIGSETMMDDIVHFRRPPVTVRYGKPYTLPPLSRDNRDEDLQKNTDEIMCRIAALLPEKYWGFYRDYPRIKELIQSGGTG